jgi:YbbR domain-containing protein
MWFRNFLQNNFWLKLFSLVLALLIWFSVRFYNKYDIQAPRSPLSRFPTRDFIEVPIQSMKATENTPRCMIEPARVDVTVTGDRSLLKNLSAKDITPFVRISDDQRVGVSSNQVQVYTPPGISLLEVIPAQVRVERFRP